MSPEWAVFVGVRMVWEKIVMGSQNVARQMRQIARRSLAGWPRIALLIIVVLTGIGTSVGGMLLMGAPQALASTNAIQAENSLPGDPTWNDFNANLDPTALSGYSSPISVNHTSTVMSQLLVWLSKVRSNC